MSKKKNKTKPTPLATPAHPSRKIVLILNPLVLVVLAACIYAGLPLEAIVSLGVVGYGIWGYLFFKARRVDRENLGR